MNRIALRGAFRLKLEDETQAFAGKRGKILADIQKRAVVRFLPTGDLNRRVIPLLVTETQDNAAGFLLRRAAQDRAEPGVFRDKQNGQTSAQDAILKLLHAQPNGRLIILRTVLEQRREVRIGKPARVCGQTWAG